MEVCLLNCLKNQFKTIKELLQRATNGVTFSQDTILNIKDRIYSLASENDGVHSVLKLLGILYDLSLSPSTRELSSSSFHEKTQNHDSRRIEKVYNYMKDNYEKEIKLKDVADLVGLTEVALSRFFKKEQDEVILIP